MNHEWVKKISGETEQVKLICLPRAGAGGITYMPWKQALSERVGLYPVLLPGREKRIREPLVSDAVQLCHDILAGIRDTLNTPYLLLGHSMGGILVYELMKQIMREELPLPNKIIMAGTSLRGFRDVPNVDALSDDELAAFLTEMGGTGREMLSNENFRECYFPIIRNDYRLVRTYQFEPVKLPVPIVALAGTRDNQVDIENMYYFAELTNDFQLYEIEGDHFFTDDVRQVCPILNEVIIAG